MAGTKKSNMPVWKDERGPYSTERHGFRLDRILFHKRTRYQEVVIAHNSFYGKMLFVDGSPQSTARDEFMYHEALVHPGLCLHPGPENLLVLGGGPGAALREILRHKSAARITMVDIDGELVEVCRRLMPEWSCGAFEDPRVNFVTGDGKDWLRKSPDRFDIILMDLTDHVDLGPSFPLYTRSFFQSLKAHLSPGGIAVVQSGSLSGVETFACASIRKTMASVFAHARAYSHYIPSFFSEWSFVLASDSPLGTFKECSAIDRILAARVDAPLRFYDGETHLRMMLQPRDIRHALDATGVVVKTRPGFAKAYAGHYDSRFTLGGRA